MSVNLPSQMLIKFDNSTPQHSPDWMESVSNPCLFFLRTGLGTTCHFPSNPEDRIKLIEKTDLVALKLFALFVAFTLWLPITFIGIVLCLASSSHAQATEKASKNALMPEKPSEMEWGTFYSETARLCEKLSESMTPIHRQQFLSENKPYFIETLNRFQQNPSHDYYRNNLKSFFKQLKEDEMAEYHPAIVQAVAATQKTVKDFDHLDWLQPQSAWTVANTLVKEIASHDNAQIQRLVPLLWETAMKHHMNISTTDLIKETLEATNASPELLHSFYQIVCREAATRLQFYSLITPSQLTTLITHMNKTLPREEAAFIDMAHFLAITTTPNTQQNIIARVAAVPLALKQQPFQWIQKFVTRPAVSCDAQTKSLGIPPIEVPLFWLSMHHTLEALQRPKSEEVDLIKDREMRIESITSALFVSYKVVCSVRPTGRFNTVPVPKFEEALFNLSDTLQADDYAMIIESLERVRDQCPKDLIRSVHFLIVDFVGLLLKSPQAEKIAYAVYEAYIPAMSKCRTVCLEGHPCIHVQQHIPFQATGLNVFYAAADAAIMRQPKHDGDETVFHKIFNRGKMAINEISTHIPETQAGELYNKRALMLDERIRSVLKEVTAFPDALFPTILNYIFPFADRPQNEPKATASAASTVPPIDAAI